MSHSPAILFLPSQEQPCLIKPTIREVHWWHLVGVVKDLTKNWWVLRLAGKPVEPGHPFFLKVGVWTGGGVLSTVLTGSASLDVEGDVDLDWMLTLTFGFRTYVFSTGSVRLPLLAGVQDGERSNWSRASVGVFKNAKKECCESWCSIPFSDLSSSVSFISCSISESSSKFFFSESFSLLQ